MNRSVIMKFPPRFLESLRTIAGFDEQRFIEVHDESKQITSIRINPAKNPGMQIIGEGAGFHIHSKVPWTEEGYYLSARPSFTFDPLFHAGCYYVQEASSMFIEEVLRQTVDLSSHLKILDLSAAPGGKSTHIQSLITTDSILVANEVIRGRAYVLKDNVIKWGCDNVIVTNNDPADFDRFENYFDVIVVDAPCSGSGLFRKDPDAINEWSENNVLLCSQRQQRIIADILPCLKQNGILVYSTCSYSTNEDELIADWIMQSFPVSFRPLNINPEWGIVDTGRGYRFWPDRVMGEGFFISCFQKTTAINPEIKKSKKRLEPASIKEKEILNHYVDNRSLEFFKHDQTVYGWPISLVDDFNFIVSNLKVIYSGVLMGEVIREKLIPEHSLALYNGLAKDIPRAELNLEHAISYLQRKAPELNLANQGWQVVTYKKFSLGWINAIQRRINNYYPKELRIIKDN